MATATVGGKRSSLAAVRWQPHSQLKAAGRAHPCLHCNRRPVGLGIHSGSKAPTAIGALEGRLATRKALSFVDVTVAASS